MSYLATVLADAPKHYWRLAEQGGSLLHDIGSTAKHLGFQPATPQVLSYSGIAADGGSAWCDSGFSWRNHDPESPGSPCSIELWVWLLANTQSVRFLFDFGGSTSTGIDIALSNADHFGADWAAGHVTGVAAVPQIWHHLVATYAAGTLTFYVDGASQGTAANATAASSSTIALGSTAGQTLGFSAGAMAEAAFYTTALSAARVSAHYAAREYSGAPVFGASGLLTAVGGGSVGFDDSLLTQILQSVHTSYA